MAYKILEKEVKSEGRGLFGLSPSKEAVVFPRATAYSGASAVNTNRPFSKEIGQDFLAALDALSIPGRSLASLTDVMTKKSNLPMSKQFEESFKRTEALPNTNKNTGSKISTFVENFARDPISVLSLISGGTTSLAKEPIKQALKSSTIQGTKAQVMPAITRQTEQSVEEGNVKPEQALSMLTEIGAGGVGSAGGKLLSKATIVPSKMLMKSALKVKDVSAKKAGKTIEEGVNNVVNTIDEFGLESKTGGVSGIAKNAQKEINKQMVIADNLMDDFIDTNPNATIDVDNTFVNLMDNFQRGREIKVFGNESQAAKKLSDIHAALELRGLTGVQPVSNLPEIKRTISEGMELFNKGQYNIGQDPLPRRVGELAYLSLKNELESFIPEIQVPNSNISKLINVKNVSEEASKRMGNNNTVSLTDIGMLPATYVLGKTSGMSTAQSGKLALVTALLKKLGERGRLASTVMSTSHALPDISRSISAEATSKPTLEEIMKILQGGN